jgi:hypothetical protein
METETTYRVGSLNDPHNIGKTAATAELAKFAAVHISRTDCLVLERTVWENKDGKMRPAFTVIDDAEHRPGEWKLGERSTFF